MNRILVSAFLMISIIITTSLLGCVSDRPDRYQIITAGGITELMDMKTLDLYYNYGADLHKVTVQGVDTVVKELPE